MLELFGRDQLYLAAASWTQRVLAEDGVMNHFDFVHCKTRFNENALFYSMY